MFTGIITAVGHIVDVQSLAQNAGDTSAGVRLTIEVADFLRPDTRLGDSIAIQGACMTVIDMALAQQPLRLPSAAGGDVPDPVDRFCVDVSRESLSRTAGLDAEGSVNLEHAMRLGDTLDGHLVSGHVDGLGTVQTFQPVGESWLLRIRMPSALAPYMAYKGSITVNGVSLTVNEVEDHDEGCDVCINLIPHTVAVTTLGSLKPGVAVNLEVDMIARYVERMLALRATPANQGSSADAGD